MKIAVFIKQVPDTQDVQWTENNNIDRTKMESIMNPVDRQAIEAALQIKEKTNAYVTAITMGPGKAQRVLEEAIAMGVDEAYLLFDAKFAGSDTWATSLVLSSVIKSRMNDTNLIILGQTAIDGETGQTGTSTAARLNFPCISHVTSIVNVNEEEIEVISESEKERETSKAKFPVALCINNFDKKPRIPKIDGYIKAKDYYYNIYNASDIYLDASQIGVKGSPTYVSKVYRTQTQRICEYIDITNENYAKELADKIKGVME